MENVVNDAFEEWSERWSTRHLLGLSTHNCSMDPNFLRETHFRRSIVFQHVSSYLPKPLHDDRVDYPTVLKEIHNGLRESLQTLQIGHSSHQSVCSHESIPRGPDCKS